MFDISPVRRGQRGNGAAKQIEDLLTGKQRSCRRGKRSRASRQVGLCSQGRARRCAAHGSAEGKHLDSGLSPPAPIASRSQQLLAHRLLGKSQRWDQPLLAIADQGVTEVARPLIRQPLKLFHLLAEAEGAGRCASRSQNYRGVEFEGIELPADRRLA